MQKSFREMIGYAVYTSDGEIGPLKDLLIDLSQWSILFLVVGTGGEGLMVPPEDVGVVDHPARRLTLLSDMQGVRERPVSEKLRIEMSRYRIDLNSAEGASDEKGPVCAGEMIGYHVQAEDGIAGHVVDMIVDAREWTVDSCVVDPSRWMPGPRVLAPVGSVEFVDRGERVVRVALDRAGVAGCRPYSGDSLAAVRR